MYIISYIYIYRYTSSVFASIVCSPTTQSFDPPRCQTGLGMCSSSVGLVGIFINVLTGIYFRGFGWELSNKGLCRMNREHFWRQSGKRPIVTTKAVVVVWGTEAAKFALVSEKRSCSAPVVDSIFVSLLSKTTAPQNCLTSGFACLISLQGA